MDHRLYFVLGDLLANVLSSAFIGWVCSLFISPEWNMWIAMFVAMAAGMFIALILWLPFGTLFGAMEVMLPMMFSGMMSSMVVGMKAAMMPLAASDALFLGGVCGLICLVIIWILNNSLRGVTSAR